jgi:hypothetical protein
VICGSEEPGIGKREIDPQRPHRALALIRAQPALFVRHGAVITDWKHRGARRLGPYYRLRYRDGRRVRSIYLGRDGPLVDQVRQALAAVQAPWQRRRAYQRWRREIVASLHGQKAALNRRLRVLGLRLQGYEVRGWRSNPVRLKTRRCSG